MSRHSVDGESLASRRKMTTAEEVKDNPEQRRMERSEGVDRWECGEFEDEEEGTGCPRCRSKYWAHEDQRDELSKVIEGREYGFVQSPNRLNTCKRQEETDVMTSASRSNKFDLTF